MHIKIGFLVLILFLFNTSLQAQKAFAANLLFESDISDYNIVARYDNGIATIAVEDTIRQNHTVITGVSYAKIISLYLYAIDKKNKQVYSVTFLINNPQSFINISFNPFTPDSFFYVSKTKNAQEFHFAKTPFFKNMLAFSKAESNLVDSAMRYSKSNNFTEDPALKRLFISMMKKRCQYLKNNAQNDYSFWYFRNQIYPSLTGMFHRDSMVMTLLKDTYTDVFAAAYDPTVEGETVRNAIFNTKLQIGDYLPELQFTDMDNHIINTGIVQDKIILIDFWAGWCPPCVEKLSFIKNIRETYDTSKLLIIGVNMDYTIKAAENAISKYNVTWPNYFDDMHIARNKLVVEAIPVLIVADRNHQVIYNSQLFDDEEQLLKIFAGLSLL